MKTNAIIRIIIWSLVIVLLVGVLNSVLFGWRQNRRYDDSPVETLVPVRDPEVKSDKDDVLTATVTREVEISITGGDTENTIGTLSPGDTVEYYRISSLNGEDWVRISAPEEGWIPASALDLPEIREKAAVSVATGSEFTVNADQVHKISIEWVAGDITIVPVKGIDQIRFTEDADPDNRYQLSYKVSGEELKILFSKEMVKFSGISIGSGVKKDLLIEVPAEWVCRELELDVAAANLEVRDLIIHEVDFDGAAGICNFHDCVIGDLDMDSASGDITLTGQLENLDFDAASASFTGVFINTPRSVDVDGMSGSVDITLPADGGYTVSIDGLSCNFGTDSHNTEYHNGMHVYGDGSCRIQLDGMSCDLTVRLASAASAGGTIPAAPEASGDPTAPQASGIGTHIHTSACETDPDSCPDLSATHHNEHN